MVEEWRFLLSHPPASFKAKAESSLGMLNKLCGYRQGETEASLSFLLERGRVVSGN